MLEHKALLRGYGGAQRRCSEVLLGQALEITRLKAQVMRLRAAVIVRDTALGWAREDQAALEAAIPGLPNRARLMRRVEALVSRLQDLMRERLHWIGNRHGEESIAPMNPRVLDSRSMVSATRIGGACADDPEDLEASLCAADLVICQAGCLSDGDYWRVQDHCRRTGKACILVEQPDTVRIVHILDGLGEKETAGPEDVTPSRRTPT